MKWLTAATYRSLDPLEQWTVSGILKRPMLETAMPEQRRQGDRIFSN